MKPVWTRESWWAGSLFGDRGKTSGSTGGRTGQSNDDRRAHVNQVPLNYHSGIARRAGYILCAVPQGKMPLKKIRIDIIRRK